MTKTNDLEAIIQTINNYFLGSYSGNQQQLLLAFHPNASISGILNGDFYEWMLDDLSSAC